MEEFSKQTQHGFKLQNIQEVEVFEQYLDEYTKTLYGASLSHISLASSYSQLQQKDGGSRIFAALVDLKLSFVLLQIDHIGINGTWGQYFSRGKHEGGSVLDSKEKFFGKMEIQKYSTSYVLRYRALWDKIMGFLVLLFSSSDYDSFIQAKSRKTKFKTIAQKITQIPNDLVQQIDVFITLFDDSYRTAEAHGTGVLRKYNFLMNDFLDDPINEFIGYWNFVNEIMLSGAEKSGKG